MKNIYRLLKEIIQIRIHKRNLKVLKKFFLYNLLPKGIYLITTVCIVFFFWAPLYRILNFIIVKFDALKQAEAFAILIAAFIALPINGYLQKRRKRSARIEEYYINNTLDKVSSDIDLAVSATRNNLNIVREALLIINRTEGLTLLADATTPFIYSNPEKTIQNFEAKFISAGFPLRGNILKLARVFECPQVAYFELIHSDLIDISNWVTNNFFGDELGAIISFLKDDKERAKKTHSDITDIFKKIVAYYDDMIEYHIKALDALNCIIISIDSEGINFEKLMKDPNQSLSIALNLDIIIEIAGQYPEFSKQKENQYKLLEKEIENIGLMAKKVLDASHSDALDSK